PTSPDTPPLELAGSESGSVRKAEERPPFGRPFLLLHRPSRRRDERLDLGRQPECVAFVDRVELVPADLSGCAVDDVPHRVDGIGLEDAHAPLAVGTPSFQPTEGHRLAREPASPIALACMRPSRRTMSGAVRGRNL